MTETITVEAITRRRRFRFRGWLVWLLIVLAAAGAGFYWLDGRGTTSAAPRYVTTKAARGDITVAVTAVGTVEPIQQVDVGSLISGTISEVDVAVNQSVTKGQVLARLDTSSLEAELAGNEATLAARNAEVADATAARDAAAASLERARKMRDKGLNSLESLAEAQTTGRRAEAGLAMALANVKVAEAQVKLAQTNLAKAVILAPIDGMVLDLQADLGQTVSASTSTVVLFTLAHDLGQMQLQVDVDEANIGKVQVGDSARFSVDAYLGQSFPAQVSEMHFAPQTVDGIVTYATILAIDNSNHRLRPGMTASADITVEEVKGVLTVPNAAFRYAPPATPAAAQRSTGLLGMLFSSGGPGGNRGSRTSTTNDVTRDGYRNLYILKGGQPVQIAVKTGVTNGDLTEVLDGPLADGDAVITAQQAADR